MKKTYNILSLFLLTNTLFGQGVHVLKYSDHFLLKGDTLLKQQVEFIEPGKKGTGLFWDFQNLKPINESYKLTYICTSTSDTSQICGLEHNTRYYYKQLNDTLRATGFENSTTLIKYVQPELRLRYPMCYGDTFFSLFSGKGQYCNRIPLSVKGYTQVQIDGEGDILLPQQPVIKKALRVHTHRHYTETGKDSMEMNYEIYSWYAAGSRYPVLESVKTSMQKLGHSDSIVFTTSFYYPPEKQIELIVDSAKLAVLLEKGNITQIFTEASYQPNPVVDYLNIDFKLTRDAKVWFSVHNTGGVLEFFSSPQNLAAGRHDASVNMNGLISGVYLLYVHIDDLTLKVGIIKV